MNSSSVTRSHVTTFKAIALLSYYGCFRISELLKVGMSTDHTILVSNVWKKYSNGQCQSIKIHLHSSKFSGDHIPDIIIQHRTVSRHCPVLALIEFLSVSGNGEHLFTGLDNKCIFRTWFVKYLSYALTGLGLDKNLYNTHSFRIGATIDMASKGALVTQIKLKGRFGSYASLKYLRPEIGVTVLFFNWPNLIMLYDICMMIFDTCIIPLI